MKAENQNNLTLSEIEEIINKNYKFKEDFRIYINGKPCNRFVLFESLKKANNYLYIEYDSKENPVAYGRAVLYEIYEVKKFGCDFSERNQFKKEKMKVEVIRR